MRTASLHTLLLVALMQSCTLPRQNDEQTVHPAASVGKTVDTPQASVGAAGSSDSPFSMEFGVGFGFSYGQAGVVNGLFELDPSYETYLDRLGLQLTENSLTARLGATYAFSDGAGVFASVPVGVVTTPDEANLPGLVDTEVGLGDVTFGGYVTLLSGPDEGEEDSSNEDGGSWFDPSVTLIVSGTSDTSEYSSLGNGLWDATGGIQARNFFGDSFFLSAHGAYTERFEAEGIEPDAITSFGGGLGFIFDGYTWVSATVTQFDIGETRLDGAPLLPESDDTALNVSIGWGTTSISAFVSGLSDGFDSEANTFGLEVTTSF